MISHVLRRKDSIRVAKAALAAQLLESATKRELLVLGTIHVQSGPRLAGLRLGLCSAQAVAAILGECPIGQEEFARLQARCEVVLQESARSEQSKQLSIRTHEFAAQGLGLDGPVLRKEELRTLEINIISARQRWARETPCDDS